MRKRPCGFVAIAALTAFLIKFKVDAAEGTQAAVAGIVRLKGAAPVLQNWKLDEAMQKATGDKTYQEETWIVGPNGGLANCVITLTPKSPTDAVVAPPVKSAVMSKVGVRYVPRVLVVTPATEVVLRNEASPCRGFQITGHPRYPHDFNYLIPEGSEQKITMRGPDRCSVTCPIRPYVRGYIVVVDTPYFAVTGPSGRFAVAGVPPGEYRVGVWLEGVGKVPADAGPVEVTVTKNGAMDLSFWVTPPKPKAN